MRLNRVFFLNTQTLEWRPGPEPNQPASAAVVTSSEAEPAASGMLALSSTKPSRQNRIFVPRGRQRHSACCVGGGRILMFGGFDGAKWLNDVFVLNALVVLCSSGGREEVLHQRALLQGLGALLEKEALSDVSLVVQGEEIKAHRCILAANCPYFEVMFRTAMKESTAQRIQVQGASPAAVRALVRYLYTAHFAEDEEDILVEVTKETYRQRSAKSTRPRRGPAGVCFWWRCREETFFRGRKPSGRLSVFCLVGSLLC